MAPESVPAPESPKGVGVVLVKLFVLGLPIVPLLVRPAVVYRCAARDGAAACTVERRVAGLVPVSRLEVAGIRGAESGTVTRRHVLHEPGRPQQTYQASSTVGRLVLLGDDERVVFEDQADNTVGRSAEWIAAEVAGLAEGRRTEPFLVWYVTWITALFSTVLGLVILPAVAAEVIRRVRPGAGEGRAALGLFVFLAAAAAVAWALALLGRFPAPLATLLGLPAGV